MKIVQRKTPPAPSGLSDPARKWWQRIHDEFLIADQHGLLLLEQALRSFDRMSEAGKLVDSGGIVQKDRFGADKINPAVAVERDSRSSMLAALKALNLDLEPLHDRPGRPPGGRGR